MDILIALNSSQPHMKHLTLFTLLCLAAPFGWGDAATVAQGADTRAFITVELPNGKLAEVPEGTSDELIKEYAIDTGLATQKDYDEAAAKEARQRIYDACLMDKSTSYQMDVKSIEQAVIRTCKRISEEPSTLDKMRY